MTSAIAIFDLDGTLTTRDSFLGYLLTFGRRYSRHRAMATLPLWIAGYLGKTLKDYQLKQKLIANFIVGADPDAISEHTAWFCDNWLPRHLHPVGNQLLQGHFQQQHRVILLSASPNIFVPQVAKALGIQEVVCTQVKQAGGVWQGELEGRNCKGEQKLVRIQSYLESQDEPVGSYSYGDSKSDLPLLSWVEHGAWIRRKDFVPIGDSPRSVFPTLE